MKIILRWRLLVTLLLTCVSLAAHSADNTTVLVYDDFGPQIIAHDLIGMQNWQWDTVNDGNPNPTLDIKVIVYRGVSLEQVKSQFPVSADIKQDFRYVEYSKALAYLNYHIEQNVLPIVADSLRQTHDKIIAKLGR